MSSSSEQKPDTVLVVGATGNIGIAAIHGALRHGYNVLAIVRNSNSAQKLIEHVGEDQQRITIVEADVVSDHGVQGVVDQVRRGALPAFQHVYATVGGEYTDISLLKASTDELRRVMTVNFESNFFVYRATVPYLLEQQERVTTFTLCTGAIGDMGLRALPAMSQGALYSMSNAAYHELSKTNVRYNEVYLAARVEVDKAAEENSTMKASRFGRVYEKILADSNLRSCRIRVSGEADVENLRWEQK